MLDALVLDVKVGKGAFIKDEIMARELASRMVSYLLLYSVVLKFLVSSIAKSITTSQFG